MRAPFYWMVVTVIAVVAAHASDIEKEAASVLWVSPSQLDVLPVPEPSRAVLLGIGIMAIAFTYRRAWLNLKRKD